MDALLNKVDLVITFALQLFILGLLIKRRLRQRFFWFFAYIVYELVETALRLSVAGNKTLYFSVFWWTEIGDVILSVMAVRESFLNVFQEYTRLRWFMWMVWGWVGTALLYALFKALAFPPFPATRQGTIIIGLALAVDYTLAAVGVLYFGLTVFLKIRAHQWESGVVAGFTIYVTVMILAFLSRSVFGIRFGLVRSWLPAIAYLIAEIGWVVVLSRSERKVPAPQRDLMIEDVTTLNQYIKILARFLGGKP